MTDDHSTGLDAPANDPMVTGIVDRLRRELDASLSYHTPAHTEDVVHQALALAKLDALDAHSMLLIAVAAAFHDAGFLVTRSGHESISADMATSAMARDKRFSQTDIGLVADMIMDTQVYQTGAVHRSNTPLSAWLLDADLANFGRDDFFEQFHLVALENKIEPDCLISATIDLMDRHTWQSPAGSACFESKKRKNREALTQASF
jgi:predicted metal-dependent HD superfamily phosphohydrolase